VYFLNKQKKFTLHTNYYVSAVFFLVSFAAICGFAYYSKSNPHFINLLISSLIFSVVTFYSFNINYSKVPGVVKKIDKVAGDLSYPIYLIHWPIGLLMGYLTHISLGYKLYLVVYPVTLAVSYLIIIFLEKYINNIRSKILERARSKAPSNKNIYTKQ